MIAGIVAGQAVADSGGGGSDPYWASVVALVHADGTDGSTTITDSKGIITWTPSGDSQLSSTQSKFGETSISFDGSADFVVGSSDSVFQFAGDFTVEMWVYGNIASSAMLICSDGAGGGSGKCYIQGSSVSINNTVIIYDFALDTTNTWKHIALTRTDNNVRLFQNGVQVGSTATSSATADFRAPHLGHNSFNYSDLFTGYIDELRITAGVARYTATFTPPTVEFPNS